MTLVRRPDWEQRLVALVRERRTMAYRYGVNDCGTFMLDAVATMTGVDLLPGVTRPTGWLSAAKFFIARGWDDVEDMATELLGEPVGPAASRPGDVVSFERDDELHLAVRVGSDAVTPTQLGLDVVMAAQWRRRAWLVG